VPSAAKNALEEPHRPWLVPARGYRCGDFPLAPSAAEHKAAVDRAVDYIWRGDMFQANICLRLEPSFDGDPLDVFCQAVGVPRPPYAAFIRMSAAPWPACRPSCSCAGRAGPW
jgi:anthranilate/para-aminobenzoate synthase component I